MGSRSARRGSQTIKSTLDSSIFLLAVFATTSGIVLGGLFIPVHSISDFITVLTLGRIDGGLMEVQDKADLDDSLEAQQ